MINTLVVDDNEKARIALISDIDDYCETINVVGQAGSVEEAFKVCIKTKPELIFLDIKMGDGTGFDLLEKLKSIDFQLYQVIFTTAYDEYALQAFKYAALDYLLKPVSAEDLLRAVNRISVKVERDYSEISNPYTSKQKKLAIAEHDRIHMIDIGDIISLEADKNYTKFEINGKKNIVASKNLKHYEELLDSNLFLRVHHTYLANAQHINQFVKNEGNYLIMSNGNTIPVSARKKDAVVKRLKNG